MKRKGLEKTLTNLGWWFKRHGSKHDLWTNGEDDEAIPRHNEINELLAKKIVKNAQMSIGSKANENRWQILEK